MPHAVIVLPYDPDWPQRFRRERSILEAVLRGCAASIEHIGSTEVPGLGAKPVIDVTVGVRAFHLHCVVEGSETWVRHLAFRDALRARPESAAAYHALKCELAERCGKDKYTEAKGPFIEGVLAAAPGGDRSGTGRP